MVSSNDRTPVTILGRRHLGLLALFPLLPFLLRSCDPTALVMTEPGVLASATGSPMELR